LSNADGSAVSSGADLIARLVRQVTLPVRWDLCMRGCADLGVNAVVELAPGGVLAGIAKRELPGAEIVAVKTPDDLDAARAVIERTGANTP
jgi:[acyl-carrier-protein] S-malonyltransferase